MKYIILALVLGFTQPVSNNPAAFDQGKKLTLSGDYEASLALLKDIKPNRNQYNEYCFMMAVNYFALNQKAEAAVWIKNLSDSFEPLTRRHASLVYMMEEDIKNWKDGDLPDIGRDMGKSADRLTNGRGGQTTQKIQKQIVDKLDKLIKEQEDAQAAAKAAAEAKAGGAKPKPGQTPGQVPGPGQTQPTDPASESVIMGGKGDGKIDEKTLRKIAESWGTLPPAARAKVVADITRELPPKFEIMIKNYFEALNKIYPQK